MASGEDGHTATHSTKPIAPFGCPVADKSPGCANKKFARIHRLNGHLKKDHLDRPGSKYVPISQDIYDAVIVAMREEPSATQQIKWRRVCGIVRSGLNYADVRVPMYAPTVNDVAAFLLRIGSEDRGSWTEEETRIFDAALQYFHQAGNCHGEPGLADPESFRCAFRWFADILHIMQS